jgi:biopolymer transport protein ExbD
MPQAEDQDSMIVAVTATGRAYFGITPVEPVDLVSEIQRSLSSRRDKMLYVKVDAHAKYADVAKVLASVREAGVEAPGLLTAQRDSPEPVYPVPPKGLEVRLGPPLPPASESVLVEALNSGRPTLSVNGEHVPLNSLHTKLRRLFQNRSNRVVVLKGGEPLRFGEIVQVIDTCRSADAQVVLVISGV